MTHSPTCEWVTLNTLIPFQSSAGWWAQTISPSGSMITGTDTCPSSEVTTNPSLDRAPSWTGTDSSGRPLSSVPVVNS